MPLLNREVFQYVNYLKKGNLEIMNPNLRNG